VRLTLPSSSSDMILILNINAHGGPFHERIVAKVNAPLDYTTAMIAFKFGKVR
jgi:hypothetical protein